MGKESDIPSLQRLPAGRQGGLTATADFNRLGR